MPERPIQAVIFDFDGVIVHSIEVHAVAYRSVLAPLGIPVTMEDVFVREGARSESIIGELAKQAGVDLTPEAIARLGDLKQQLFSRIGAPRPYPSAQGVVEAVAERGFPMAIVTGTRRENVSAIAPGIAPLFDHLVTQESYSHDKPHPEPFLTAAEALGVDPASCLVIENAPRGVESARRAGMAVVAVTSTLPAARLEQAHVVVDRLEEILAIIPAGPGRQLAGVG